MVFLLSLLLVLLLVRYMLPLLLRAAVGRFVRGQMRRPGAQRTGQTPPFGAPYPPPPTAPGQVRVDYVPPTAKKPEFKGGEYVEYKEV